MSFEVEVQPSGHRITVEEGETILDAALRQNIGLPYGCRNGVCGSCKGRLLEGAVSYPEGPADALELEDEDICVTCKAVPASNLVVELAEVEMAAEIQVKTLPTRVVHVEHLNHDVVRLQLKLPDEQRLQFMAGQYLNFLLDDGRKRAFSIANAPHDDEFIELHVRHVDGGEFTDYVFAGMQEKTILRIEAPLGSFTLREESERPIILIAGGTGLAPVKGIIEHAFHVGVERPMELYWGVRSSRDLYLPLLPEQWALEHANFRYVPVLSDPDGGWQGRTGWVHEAVLADHPDMSGFDVYMAGPPVMVTSGRDAFLGAGLTMEHMFSDAFEWAKD